MENNYVIGCFGEVYWESDMMKTGIGYYGKEL